MPEGAGTPRTMRTAVPIFLIALGALCVPAGASAQASPEPVFSPTDASVQLDQAVEALTTADPAAAHPTDELRDLAAALPLLEGRERRQARAILARPPADEGGTEPFGAEWPDNADEDTLETDHFIVHWPDVPGCSAPTQGCDEPDLTDDRDSSAPDYIDDVAAAAEESFEVENGELEWPAPKPDGNRGGNEKIDVYVADICNEGPPRGACIFGYANPDDPSGQCQQPPFRCFAYLVLDNDYNFEEFGYDDPGIPLRVTTAHEYNHILQFRLDSRQDDWMFESTAVWSEEQVFEDDDDWLFYLDVWKRTSEKPITSFNAGGGLKVYGSAVWNHWLHLGAGYGPDVILDAWESSRQTDPKDFAIAAYDRAIRENGGQGFSQEFGRFAAATAEWQVDDGDFSVDDATGGPDETQFPDVRRQGTLSRRKNAKRFDLDHTAYRLLRVNPRSDDTVKLKVQASRKVRTAAALIGRDGNRLTGDVDTELDYSNRGGKLAVRLPDAQDYDRITAVVANADGRARGFAGDDRDYTRDEKRFRVRVR